MRKKLNRGWGMKASLLLNLLLAAVLVWVLIQSSFDKKLLISQDVQLKLVELEGLIAFEEKTNWSSPNKVTQKLGEVIERLYEGIEVNRKRLFVNKSDIYSLATLKGRLGQYPLDDLYAYADVDAKDKEHFSSLRVKLREAGIGLYISHGIGWKDVIEKVNLLNKSIPVPLE